MRIEMNDRWHAVRQAVSKVAGGTMAAMLAGTMLIGAAGCAAGESADAAESDVAVSKVVSDDDKNAAGAVSSEAGHSGASDSATSSSASGGAASSVQEIDESLYDTDYSDRDLDSSYDESAAVKVTLSGTTASIEGSGASADGSTVTISESGTYILSGKLSDGQIVVDAADDAKVQIVLDGVDITKSDGSAIYVKQADKCFLTLSDGSQNSIADGSSYALGDDENDPDAAIYAECDLTLQGGGSLTVDARYNDGIKTKDDLVISGGSYSVTAKVDAIVGNDSVKIADGTISVKTTEGDGIKSSKDDDESKGFVVIDGGTIEVDAGDKGIKAETYLRIADGAKLEVKAADDAIHTNGSARINGGDLSLESGDDAVHAEYVLDLNGGTLDIVKCTEGLEGQVINVNDGAISIVSSDDAVNASSPEEAKTSADDTKASSEKADATEDTSEESEQSAASDKPSAENGTQQPMAESSGSASDGQPAPKEMNGESSARNETDAKEQKNTGESMDNQGGNNASDGSGESGNRGEFGGFGGRGGAMMETDENCAININGGTLTLEAEGDGLDSNGYINLAGGIVYISGPTNSGNGSLDTGLGAKATGGTLIAAGASGMAESFSEGTQGFALVPVDGKAGSKIAVLDAEGNELASYTPTKDYQCVVVTAPGMKTGTSYDLSIDGTKTSFEATNTGNSGMGMGGQEFGGQRPDANQGNDRQGARPERHGKPGERGGMRESGPSSNQEAEQDTLA